MDDNKNLEKKMKTSQLLKDLFKATTIEQYLDEHEEDCIQIPFYSYLRKLCLEKNLLPADVIKRANLETSYGYQIFKGKRNPSRDTVIQLAFGFEANFKQAQLLLRQANMSQLYPRVKRDAVVIYCLQHKMTLMDTQSILMELDLQIIGGKKNG